MWLRLSFAHWDGTIDADEVGNEDGGDLRLTSLVRQQFGQKSVELSFAGRFVNSGEIAELEIVTADGQPRIGVIPAAGSRVRPRPGSRLDPDSLVGAVLELSDPQTSKTITRRPRRVVPLRRDDLLGVAVEIDRVQLADDVSLLVQDDPKPGASSRRDSDQRTLGRLVPVIGKRRQRGSTRPPGRLGAGR